MLTYELGRHKMVMKNKPIMIFVNEKYLSETM